MPIVPDTKDWTWVLDRPCPECGFDARSVSLESIPRRVKENAEAWRSLLAASDRVDLARRPSDDRWSTLEYACHVRDVYRLANIRVDLMVSSSDPVFENWDQDATAVDDRYREQDPAMVADEIDQAAQQMARRYASLPAGAAQWTGTRGDGARFTIASFGRYLVHDPVHHLVDVSCSDQKLI